MFFQETTPDTSGYMIAGYAVAFIVMALYVLSIYLRNRNLEQDLTMLEDMDKSAAQTPNSSARQARPGQTNPAANKSAKTVTK